MYVCRFPEFDTFQFLPPPFPLDALDLPLTPPIAALDHLVAANVRAQVANVAASAPVQAAWKKNQKLHVHGWVYRLETGLLEDLHVTQPPMAAPSGT
jgi:carbonic anhydrase